MPKQSKYHLIKEPKGVNLVVDPTPLTEEDKLMISDTIAHYKATGKKKWPTPKKKATSASKAKR